MSFVSYPHLIFLISGQTFQVTVVHEKFWELNGPEVLEFQGHTRNGYFSKGNIGNSLKTVTNQHYPKLHKHCL